MQRFEGPQSEFAGIEDTVRNDREATFGVARAEAAPDLSTLPANRSAIKAGTGRGIKDKLKETAAEAEARKQTGL